MHTLSPLPLCYLHVTTILYMHHPLLLHTPSHPFPSTMLYPSDPFPSTPTLSPSHLNYVIPTHPPLTLSLSINTTHHQHNAVLDYMPFSTSISIGGPHGAMACRYLVSIDDVLYQKDEMFCTILTPHDETFTNDIAIATILDDDGELYVQQLTQTHKASALISEYIYKGTTYTAWFSSCLLL